MVLRICQFPLGTFDVSLTDPVPIDTAPDNIFLAAFEQDAVTFAPLNVIKTTRFLENYFEGQPRFLRDTSFAINISTVVDFCIKGYVFQNYHVVIDKLIKHCLETINGSETHFNAFFQNVISLQYEHVLSNKTDIQEIQKDMMYRETLKHNIVEYVSDHDRDIIAFQIVVPRTTLMTHEHPFYFIDIKRHLILNASQVLNMLVKTRPALNTCTMFIPFGLYFEDLCFKTCIDTFKTQRMYGFDMTFNVRLNAWMFNTGMSLFVLDEHLFKRLTRRCSTTLIKFVSEISDINDIVFPLQYHVIIRYDILKKIYFKFMTKHDNQWISILHGNNEMTFRAYQNKQIDPSNPLPVSIFQVHWKRIITNISSFHVYFELFKSMSSDIIWALTHDISDIQHLMAGFYAPTELQFYDFMKNYDALIKIFDINIPSVSSFMNINLQKNLKEIIGINDMYYGTTVQDYLAHINANNNNFVKNLTENQIETSHCPVCLSPVKDMTSFIGASCGHVICTACFTHSLLSSSHSAHQPCCCVCRSEMKRIIHIDRQHLSPPSEFHEYKQTHGTKKGFVLWILKMLSLHKSTSIVIIDNDFFTKTLHPNIRLFFTQQKFVFLDKINIYYNQQFKNEAFKRIHHIASNTSNVFFITYDDAFELSTYLFDTARFRHLHINSVFVFSPPCLNTGFLRKTPEQIDKCASRFIYNIQTYLGHDIPISLVSYA